MTLVMSSGLSVYWSLEIKQNKTKQNKTKNFKSALNTGDMEKQTYQAGTVKFTDTICCIMGNVGSSVFGVWPILGTKRQDIMMVLC